MTGNDQLPPGEALGDADRGAHDWTQGGDGLVFQHCAACGQRGYFHRDFCPGCGARPLQLRRSAGLGRVMASTLVHRAPSDEFRALAPYRIVLVDLAEGVRLMAHGDAALAIGDAVQVGLRQLAGRWLPYATASEAVSCGMTGEHPTIGQGRGR